SISDEELDNVVISIKNEMPTAGYRMVMYLGASTNNRASTAYGFFLEATQRHGVPLRRKARGPLLLLPLDCLTLPSPSLLPVAKIRLLLSLYSRLSVAHLHLLSLNLICEHNLKMSMIP
ncbi:hypothetical protein NQZ68_033601, partial [Dissostichus eleginoides]